MKFLIDWSISGTTEIEADSPEEARFKFDQISNLDLASTTDERDTLEGPSTEDERMTEKEINERAWQRWREAQAEREVARAE